MSRSNDHGNIVNSTVREPLEEFEPKRTLHRYLRHLGDKLIRGPIFKKS